MKKSKGLLVLGLALPVAIAGIQLFNAASYQSDVQPSNHELVQVGQEHDHDILKPIGRYATGVFDDGATEIVMYHAGTKQLYVTNGADKTIDIISIADPTAPKKVKAVKLDKWGKSANSVAVYGDLIAAAVEAENKQANGHIVFMSPTGEYIHHVEVGALPDMVTFTPNGKYVLVANEGEPNDDYTVDPEGSVSVIDVSGGAKAAKVTNLDFKAFNDKSKLDDSVRIFGPNATVAQDLEPEYIAVTSDSKIAFVACQENNAIAVVDLVNMAIKKVHGLGTKDHSKPGNKLDASNKDGKINMTNWPVKGFYQPDAIATFEVNGMPYVVTANEGDARDYDGYSEETRIGKLKLDPKAFPNAEELQDKANLGRLKTTTANGDTDGDGDHDELYSYGGRSFSIFDGKGMVYDSGHFIEAKLAEVEKENFNSTNDENASFDNRSDDKGAEPEGLTVGMVGGKPMLFLGLERIGGIMVFDLSNPKAPEFKQYINTRNFKGDPKNDTAGDLAPEGLTFIPADKSPNGKALLVVAYEVSGSIRIFEVAE